jgi:hypothetical protein
MCMFPHLFLQGYAISGKVGLRKNTGPNSGCGGGRWCHSVPIHNVARKLGFVGITLIFDFKLKKGAAAAAS